MRATIFARDWLFMPLSSFAILGGDATQIRVRATEDGYSHTIDIRQSGSIEAPLWYIDG
jgi:hypothetical protein